MAAVNSFSTFTSHISSVLAHRELSNFSSSGSAGFLRPRQDFFTVDIIKVPKTDGRDLIFPNKRQGKKVSQRKFSTTADAYPVFLSHAGKISIPVGLLGPPQRNFLGDISPMF